MARKGLGPRTAPINREETRIQNAAIAELGSLPGVLLLVNTVGKILNPWTGIGWFVYGLGEGTPDVIGAVDGRFLALEFKRPGEKPEPHQARLHAAWRSLGIFVAVVDSVESARAAIERCRAGELE
jgi:hypothetical protein